MVRILPQLKNLRGDVDQARAQHIEKLARARMSGTASAAQGTAAAWRKRRPTWLDSLTACHAMSPPTAADVQDRRRPYPGHFRDTNCRLFIQLLDIIGVPKGIRTPVTAVKGRCPRPLDDGDREPQAHGSRAVRSENQSSAALGSPPPASADTPAPARCCAGAAVSPWEAVGSHDRAA